MHALRTRFRSGIVAEFLPPIRKSKKQRVVIIASGTPSTPSKGKLIEFFAKKGYWAFHFRYRGSWESTGKFLAAAPNRDIVAILDELPKGFPDLWNYQKDKPRLYKVKPDEVILLASSFGGAAALLASRDKRVNKTISFSPLIDWTRPGPDEPYPKMIRYFAEGYGPAFRFAPGVWKKLQSGKFFNPINHTAEIEGSKNLIIHAKDDRTCPYSITKKFATDTGSKLVTLSRGDHMSSSLITKPRFYKLFQQFIKQK